MNSMRVWTVLACISVTALVASPAFADAAAHVEGILESEGVAALTGAMDAQASEGVVHFRDSSTRLGSVHLSADRIQLTVTWENGTDVAPADATHYQQRTDSGRTTRQFTSVELTITPLQEEPEVLAIVEPGAGSIQTWADESSAVLADVVVDQTVTMVEWQDEDDQVVVGVPNTNTGFWYHVDGPWPVVRGFDGATVSRDFALFTNNVTVSVASSDQGPWAVDAGRRERPGSAPGTHEYEVRVVSVEVVGGSLDIEADDALAVYGPRVGGSFQGVASGGHVSGHLLGSSLEYVFDGVPFELRGSGDVVLRPVAAAARVNDNPAASARLELEVAGAFDVAATPGLQASATAPVAGGSALVPWAWLALAFVVAPLTVYAGYRVAHRGGVVPGVRWLGWGSRRRFRTRTLPAAESEALEALMRNHLDLDTWTRDEVVEYARLRAQATRYMAQDRYAEAAASLRRLVNACDDAPVDVLHAYARACKRARSYEEAADAYEALHEALEGAEPECLEERIRALWYADRAPAAHQALVEYSGIEPRRAARLVQRPGLQPLGRDALDRLHPDMLAAWARDAWTRGRAASAVEVFLALATRRIDATVPIAHNPECGGLCRAAVDRMPADALEGFIRVAYVARALDLARDALVQLDAEDPPRARRLAAKPAYRCLMDDPRLAHLHGARDPGRDRGVGDASGAN